MIWILAIGCVIWLPVMLLANRESRVLAEESRRINFEMGVLCGHVALMMDPTLTQGDLIAAACNVRGQLKMKKEQVRV